jgi:hypothetical protein
MLVNILELNITQKKKTNKQTKLAFFNINLTLDVTVALAILLFFNHILLLYKVLEAKVSKSIILKPFLWTQSIMLQLHKLDNIQCDNLEHLAYLNGVLNTYIKAQAMDINKIYEQFIKRLQYYLSIPI